MGLLNKTEGGEQKKNRQSQEPHDGEWLSCVGCVMQKSGVLSGRRWCWKTASCH